MYIQRRSIDDTLLRWLCWLAGWLVDTDRFLVSESALSLYKDYNELVPWARVDPPARPDERMGPIAEDDWWTVLDGIMSSLYTQAPLDYSSSVCLQSQEEG
ncbi:hypothetical protein T310_5501 [Rasamsonia emersonii CBS 393.64]|uniref:Uncharacterized protein n=1 Tax=Rasamsonia emersonii (strain ATCC 16479 / CBS 393.64 / IMI 116815) TaxID=1408163 RepID=A0A0F4YQS1_RASE3|nr:hypothetical protein T310_5501 [Rasamsonia emersonii CBS 393.64]KKA20450.1 hypothetical protein T310_5501 [Rasamsonia emersonii CBS 393.64]